MTDFIFTGGKRLLLEKILEGEDVMGTMPNTERRCIQDGLIRRYGKIYAVTQKGIGALRAVKSLSLDENKYEIN